jgi:hypothetical protein
MPHFFDSSSISQHYKSTITTLQTLLKEIKLRRTLVDKMAHYANTEILDEYWPIFLEELARQDALFHSQSPEFIISTIFELSDSLSALPQVADQVIEAFRGEPLTFPGTRHFDRDLTKDFVSTVIEPYRSLHFLKQVEELASESDSVDTIVHNVASHCSDDPQFHPDQPFQPTSNNPAFELDAPKKYNLSGSYSICNPEDLKRKLNQLISISSNIETAPFFYDDDARARHFFNNPDVVELLDPPMLACLFSTLENPQVLDSDLSIKKIRGLINRALSQGEEAITHSITCPQEENRDYLCTDWVRNFNRFQRNFECAADYGTPAFSLIEILRVHKTRFRNLLQPMLLHLDLDIEQLIIGSETKLTIEDLTTAPALDQFSDRFQSELAKIKIYRHQVGDLAAFPIDRDEVINRLVSAEYNDYLHQRTMNKQHRELSEKTGAIRIEYLDTYPFVYFLVEQARKMTRDNLSKEDERYPKIKAQLFERHLCSLWQQYVPGFNKNSNPCISFERFRIPPNDQGTIQDFLTIHNITLSLLLQENDVTWEQLRHYVSQHQQLLSPSKKTASDEIDEFIYHDFIANLPLITLLRLNQRSTQRAYSALLWAQSPTGSSSEKQDDMNEDNWPRLI